MVAIAFKRLHPKAILPEYKTKGSVGADAYSVEKSILQPEQVALIPLGFAVAIPEGYEIQVRPRSGLALKGITVLNSPGSLDWDFRGEVKVILANFSSEDFEVNVGDRIAQLVVNEVPNAHYVEVSDLGPATDRGTGGFGSTGI